MRRNYLVKMDFDAEQLLLALTQGQSIDSEELAQVRLNLAFNLESECLTADEVYGCLGVLLKLRDPVDLALIEQYLAGEDPLLVSMILESLCLQWRQDERLTSLIVQLIEGCAWDQDEDAMVSAIMVAGELLYAARAEQFPGPFRPLLLSLQQVFFESTRANFIRLTAYRALLRSAGASKDRLPSEFSRLSFSEGSTDVDWKLLDSLKTATA